MDNERGPLARVFHDLRGTTLCHPCELHLRLRAEREIVATAPKPVNSNRAHQVGDRGRASKRASIQPLTPTDESLVHLFQGGSLRSGSQEQQDRH